MKLINNLTLPRDEWFKNEVINKITLLSFDRTRSGPFQIFIYHFKYNDSEYILHHEFLYGGTGVKHWFKFKKSLFKKKPFHLTYKEYIFLDEHFMKIVNPAN